MSARIIDLIGHKYGRLLVTKLAAKSAKGSRYWDCLCDCGSNVTVRGDSLRGRGTLSCGCLIREQCRKTSTTHGQWYTPTWRSWASMKTRCNGTSNAYSKEAYADRGIRYCERWERFENFFADMGQRPAGKTLDRIDNGKGYFPGNCKWSTPKEQANNRRRMKPRKKKEAV